MKKNLFFALVAIIIFSNMAMATSNHLDKIKSATIYLYRGSLTLSGSLQDAWFYVDGLKIADLRSNQYVAYRVTPGNHTIELRSDQNYKKNSTTVILKEDDVLYLKAVATTGKSVTALVTPYMDEGFLKSFGIIKINAEVFEKARPKLENVQPIAYDEAPIPNDPHFGHVYIYRQESGINGGVQTAWIYSDGMKVANLDDHQYIVLSLPEGKHTVEVRGVENVRKDTLKLQLKAQENYYYTLETNTAHKATYTLLPILDTVVAKAFSFVPKERKDFEVIKNKMGRLQLIEEK